jgi:hypothetical protein
MHSLGKALRGSVSALGLAFLGMAAVTTVTAPAAYAQKASKEFVTNYNEATAALDAKNYALAVSKADAAQPHAKAGQEKLALESIRIKAYYATKNYKGLIKALESQQAIGGLTAEQLKANKETVMGLYDQIGDNAKAVALTKEYVNTYGGSSDKYAYLASNSLKAKNYDEAISYAQKAIDQARKEGKKPSDKMFNVQMAAYIERKDLDSYYATLEKAAAEYPKAQYIEPLIDRATKEPKFKRVDTLLDIYRAKVAAGVKLSPSDQMAMGEQALSRGMSAEAEATFAPLFKAGTVGGADDKDAARNKRLFDSAQAAAKSDKSGGLADSEKEAAGKPTGLGYLQTGEAYLGTGDYAKAAELIQKGIDKGQLDDGQIALAKLRLGIAQYKAGQKDTARKTWTDVKDDKGADNGAAALASSWILISKL